MKKITKLVCIAMALVILGCSTNGATASAAKRSRKLWQDEDESFQKESGNQKW